MSVLSVAPELVSVAAGDLSGIGSAISEANALAAAPTLGVVAPAADSVSAELAALFGGHAETYQAVSTQAQLFHQDFVRTLTGSSAAYRDAEAESASGLGKGRSAEGLRVLGSRQHQAAGAGGAASKLWQPTKPTLWRPGMSDPRLITPHHSLPAEARLWHPGVPGFKTHTLAAPRLFTPHNQLMGGVLNGSRGIVQNIGGLIEQIIQNQIGYLKLIGTSLVDFVKDELKAIIGLPAAFVQSVKDLLHGNISGAMNDVIKGFGHLLVNGFTYSGQEVYFPGDNVKWFDCVLAGALPDLAPILRIPGQELQNLADMLKPFGFGVMGNVVQHLATPLEELTAQWHMYLRAGSSYGGLRLSPALALAFDLLGAPIVSIKAFEDTLQGALDALLAGNPLRAAIDLVEAPGKATQAFFFGQDYLHIALPNAWYEAKVHVGGIFAPLDYGMDNVWGWRPSSSPLSSLTGGLIPALVSMLPPKLQDPFHSLRHFLDALVAVLTRRPVLDY